MTHFSQKLNQQPNKEASTITTLPEPSRKTDRIFPTQHLNRPPTFSPWSHGAPSSSSGKIRSSLRPTRHRHLHARLLRRARPRAAPTFSKNFAAMRTPRDAPGHWGLRVIAERGRKKRAGEKNASVAGETAVFGRARMCNRRRALLGGAMLVSTCRSLRIDGNAEWDLILSGFLKRFWDKWFLL